MPGNQAASTQPAVAQRAAELESPSLNVASPIMGNEAFVRKYLSVGSSLAQQLTVTVPATATTQMMGVVKSTASRNLSEDAPLFVYLL